VGAIDVAGSETIIRTKELSKVYVMGSVEVHALQEVSLEVREGEFVAIMGASGSGKSTLLNLLGCLDRPTSGSYFLEGRDVARLSDAELAHIRNRRIGFVFQNYNLIARLSALRNVELSLLYSRDGQRQLRGLKARRALERVGLGGRAKHAPSELSGGEQQRVAIARALVNDPPIILADEPTGNLDTATGADVLALLKALVEEGRTLIMVTHDSAVGGLADRILWMQDGELSYQELSR
jgi:putative ABC transport system ATP-binding protein